MEKTGGAGPYGDVVGFGHGTFTVTVARLVARTMFAVDIAREVVAATCRKGTAGGLTNVAARVRDCEADGTGLPADSAGPGSSTGASTWHHRQHPRPPVGRTRHPDPVHPVAGSS